MSRYRSGKDVVCGGSSRSDGSLLLSLFAIDHCLCHFQEFHEVRTAGIFTHFGAR